MPILPHYVACQQMQRGIKPESFWVRLLQHFARTYPDSLLTYVDGGAGIGCATKEFLTLVSQELSPQGRDAVRAYMYEPLPENYQILQAHYGSDTRCVLRNVALSDNNGRAKFFIPSRLAAEFGEWPAGSTYNGTLHEHPHYENIEVDCVTLDSELPHGADVVKLDLQGGEYRALLGLNSKLANTKIYYLEQQLLEPQEPALFLAASGYSVFFDRVQLSFHPRIKNLPIFQLAAHGLMVEQMFASPEIGVVVWGYFSRNVIDNQTYALTADAADAFKSIGVMYMQTDAIAVRDDFVAAAVNVLLQ